MYRANNPRTTQQLGVKQAQFVIDDPHTPSQSLEAMTPNPEETPSAMVTLYKPPDDASAGWENVECLMMLWTNAISCNRGKTLVYVSSILAPSAHGGPERPRDAPASEWDPDMQMM